jgi:hypothetical protein
VPPLEQVDLGLANIEDSFSDDGDTEKEQNPAWVEFTQFSEDPTPD